MNFPSPSRWLILGLPALAGLALAIYCMPRINPLFAANVRLDKSRARAVADSCLQRYNFSVSGFYCDEIFVYDGSALEYLMSRFGVLPIMEQSRAGQLPTANWQFDYYRNVPKDQQRETYRVRVSTSGELLSFLHVLPDSMSADTLSSAVAAQRAHQVLSGWRGIMAEQFTLEQSTHTQKLRRTDHRLVFARRAANLGEAVEVVEVHFAGTALAGVVRYLRDPQDFVTASGVVSSANILLNSMSVMVYVLLLFASLIAFLRKYHEGEIGVRTGLGLAGILLFVQLLQALNSWDRLGVGVGFGQISHLYTKFIQLGVSTAFGYLLIALMVLASWTVGEQILRAEAPRLLAGVDSIFNRKWFTKNIGRELPVGFAYGLILLGLVQGLTFLMIEHLGVLPRLSGGGPSLHDQTLPVFGMLANMLTAALFSELVFRLFLITTLRRLVKATGVAIVIAAVFDGLFQVFFNDIYNLRPSYFMLVPGIATALLQGFIFWRHGLLAAMTSAALLAAAYTIGPLLGSAAPFFVGNALAGIAVLTALPVLGIASALRGREFEFTPAAEPPHIRRIKERVRLQKELEIAHRVQLGLLPKQPPRVPGFDIAGLCVPALEVGGDYFDFVELQEGKLGIAVGDVSGKGIPAAIYMTLTKGILQSHAGEESSPKQVLSKVNNLMYRTIERNWYVSMFYAVLDSRRSVLRFARAGHNPAIIFRSGESQARLLQTAGLGLGLDPGEVFTRTLVEGELQMSPGDTLVLYTDGFTEAMNRQQEEFGEERFLQLLQRHQYSSAEALVHYILQEVRAFAGDHPQHDDMTLVVLKAI
ncbi:MAG: PP2C family protein-serine/threonine phosphatase [candidate division KSB1 bacterium]|nr:PP2C family protein-serine/threonine phosphatase [candidate division KSB1 bacterium]MDZ7273475.1 PP2C family protein-serine/threonine phosphatase [candidate division KSB1 bacterium]MDZ7286933.1 PP2C family protein-serine/threonine phosphatase [candidate division KSB1 bacterium]MDZ7299714.1 PP2C family protein-serine/threonine phosphatase [candidate division KSB1 bacterium]MDZ7305653.1 PP2C family protein-serine/threonine phosphatase [candidate division KSB1 bacterium]